MGFFDHVFSKIGDLDRSQVMIVGDSLTSDIKGGNNAGIVTCWFNPEKKEDTYGLKIDHEIQNIKEVLDLL